MNGLDLLTRTEMRLFARDRAQLFFVLALPVLLVLGFGSVPDMGKPSDDFAGQIPLDSLVAPIGIAVLLAITSYNAVPTHVVSYREKGVLRRLSASPVRASTLLAAVLLTKAIAAVVGVALVIALGAIVVGLSLPANLLGFVVVVVLGTVSLFSLGLVVAARAPTAGAATAAGMLLFFPSMFFAGVYVPREQLPSAIATVGGITPLGATLQGLRDTWIGDAPQLGHLAALIASAAVLGTIAARTFRWE
jgi:ABC-2 type transport system permease protein